MPELPEVTTIIGVLKPILLGKKIQKVTVYREKNIFSGAKDFEEKLKGKTISSISRRGKYLIFKCDDNIAFLCHLRMEGKFFLRQKDEPKQKFDLVDFYLENGTRLSYNDVRKFGGFYLADSPENLIKETTLNTLGKEPFDLDQDEFYSLIRFDQRPIKEILLDQSVIAGIGNIYDSETLFAAHIHPLTKGSELSLEECGSILKESCRILNEAIELGGSTIRSYHPGKDIDGMMQNQLLVYGKHATPCPNCGFPIRRIFVGGRSSFYCPNCQKRKNGLYIVGVTGPIASGKSTVSHYLEGLGYLHIDADRIVWELYQKKEIQSWLKKNIHRDAVKNREINRLQISKTINHNKEKKALLEAFIHEKVFNEIDKLLLENKDRKILLDVPLLIGSKYENLCDCLIYIEADEKLRRQRIASRGKDPDLALRLNASFPKKKAKSNAEILLSGNGSNDDLIRQLKEIRCL